MDVGREKGISPKRVEEPQEEGYRQAKHARFSPSGNSLY